MTSPVPPSAAPRPARKDWTWWFTFGMLILVAVVRLRLLDYPIERDEGEYAYAGQLILQGIPPYELAYNMKFPGVYAMYALMMGLFGQTAAGIHLGLVFLTTGSAMMLYWLGKRMLDGAMGMVAACSFAVLSANPLVLGLSAHATHFLNFFVIAGACLLWRFKQGGGWRAIAGAGMMFGLAVLMKQHAIFVAAWAVLFIGVFCWRLPVVSGWERFKPLATLVAGLILPFVLCGLILWQAGVFEKFWFWTIRYAHEYVSLMRWADAPGLFWFNFSAVIARGLAFWLLAVAGWVVIFFDERMKGKRAWLWGFGVSSALTIFPGLYFRTHYFIAFFPALALLAGSAISGLRQLDWGRLSRRWSSFGSVAPMILFMICLGWFIFKSCDGWFELSSGQISRALYADAPFSEAAAVGRFIRDNSASTDRLAVLGSEPELYFAAHRHSATGYIYMYPLMEPQLFAGRMQDEMIAEIEQAAPGIIVYCSERTSWLRRPGSNLRIFDWWKSYQTNYFLAGIAAKDPATDAYYYAWGQDAQNHGKLNDPGLEVYFRIPKPSVPASGKNDEAP